MNVSARRGADQKGWTLLEVAIALTIVAFLITISFPAYAFIRSKIDRAVCIGNMRSLHAGFSTYLQDHSMVWPQPPESSGDSESEEDWKWWFETLQPYGVTRKTWICPADRDGTELDESNPETLVVSYVPTEFDELPNTAYRWNTPWLIERGPNHGQSQGPNMVMPDGQVHQGMGMPTE